MAKSAILVAEGSCNIWSYIPLIATITNDQPTNLWADAMTKSQCPIGTSLQICLSNIKLASPSVIALNKPLLSLDINLFVLGKLTPCTGYLKITTKWAYQLIRPIGFPSSRSNLNVTSSYSTLASDWQCQHSTWRGLSPTDKKLIVSYCLWIEEIWCWRSWHSDQLTPLVREHFDGTPVSLDISLLSQLL